MYGGFIREFKLGFLPIRIVREVCAKMDSYLGNLDLGAKLNPVFKVLTKSAAPRMIGIAAVTDIV